MTAPPHPAPRPREGQQGCVRRERTVHFARGAELGTAQRACLSCAGRTNRSRRGKRGHAGRRRAREGMCVLAAGTGPEQVGSVLRAVSNKDA